VWIRTDDFSPVQLRRMQGGEKYETEESNPMLGWRGIARAIDTPRIVTPQFRAIKVLQDEGHNIGIFPPMARFPREYKAWKEMAEKAGLTNVKYGLMVETPAAAITFDEFAPDLDFMIFGSNDLTQFTLAIDRSNQHLAEKFDENETAVVRLMQSVIQICNEQRIESCIGGQAASDEKLIRKLTSFGISGYSVNPNPRVFRQTKEAIHRIENE